MSKIKLVDYIARGLQAKLDDAIKEHNNPKNSSKRGDIISDMNEIYRDMEFYKNQGVPLTDEYLHEKQAEIENLRDKWSI